VVFRTALQRNSSSSAPLSYIHLETSTLLSRVASTPAEDFTDTGVTKNEVGLLSFEAALCAAHLPQGGTDPIQICFSYRSREIK
jgi:hypothetical protein